MALSPADFAAYSRATGTPYPEDPEERAQLAPEVAQFRRDQLRAPQQESALPGILGATAVGLGALTGGMALARALGGKRGQAAASTAFNLPKKEEQALRTVSAAPMRQQVAEDVERQARTERPIGTVLTDLVNYRFQQGLAEIPEPTKQEFANITKSQFDRLYDESTKLPLPRTTTDPSTGRSVILDPFGIDPSSRQAVYASVAAKPESQLPRVYKPQSNIEVDLITDPNTGEIFRRGKSPETFARNYISLRPALTGQKTDLPITRTPGSFLDFSKAVSGEAAAQNLLNDPELKQLVTQQRRQEGAELGREAQRQMRVASAIESEADQYIAQLRQEALSQQTLGALESGEDQMTGRTMRSMQRNEDLDSSQVNEVLRQTGSADVAASLTPDGIPFDQSEGLQILGRFPGPEGSSSSGVEFTPVESRYEGRPFRFTRLEAGLPTEGEGSPSPLLTEGSSKYAAYGLSAPKTHVIPDDVAVMLQSTFKRQGNKLETYQRQALDLFETTGDSNYLAAAFGPAPAMAYQGRLPGGEVVQTKDLYIPIGERINPKTGEAVVDTRLEALSRAEGPEGIRSRVREQTMQQIERMTGVRPLIPSASQLASLPTVNKRAQQLAQRDIDEAQARYNQAQDFAVNYALSQEAKRGVYTGPQFEINPLTGKQIFVGMSPQVEQEAIATPSLYQMRSSGGTSRTDLGGVGRRREALESEGFSSSSEDPLAFLYKDVDTGELVEPGNVSRQDVEIGKYVPVRGTAVEPQRILGSEGRTFKGISSAEIDPRSFDPATRQELAQQYPERVTPEGLIYSEKALERPSEARQYGRKFATQPPTTYGREAVNVSLELDRLRRSGVPGAAEAFLDKIMKERGVSAQGPSQPLRQKINPQGRFTT